jgi:two-component system OmpR family sensor kinase
VSRLPIRVRLTLVFAVAMIVVLAGAALFVHLRLRADLDDSVNSSLAARAHAVATSGEPGSAAGDREEVLTQVIRPGRGSAILPPALVRRATHGTVMVERPVRGFEGTMRLLARPASGGVVVVVGQSLDDRDETLAGLLASFAIGGPIAVALASLLGYAVATAALRPVDAMRRRAEGVSLAADDVLPLPVAHDEIRRLGETLNSMLDRLRGSFERERRFVADASHELRTPIAVLQTELETLLRGEHPPEVREALLAAADEADHLARLADDLLLLARSSEGGLEVRPEPLDAAALLGAARTRFAERAAAQGRGIDLDVAPGTTVLADPLRVRQALGNLVDNALRHGAGDVRLAARAVDGGTAIEVADEGLGFPAGIADRAFERFARGDEARTRGGAGLGLAIVRAIAEAHGGSAETVGGSCVRIWLPSQAHFSAGPHAASVPTRQEAT